MTETNPGDEPFPVPPIDEPAPAPATPAPATSSRKSHHRRKGTPAGSSRPGAHGGDTTAATAAKKRTKLETEARRSLQRFRAEFGAGMMMVVPVPAAYVARTDDEVIEAMVKLAGRNAKLLQAIASGGDLLAVVTVGRWVAGLGAATAVQFGRMAPDSRAAATLGITDLVVELERDGFIGVEDALESGDGDTIPGDVDLDRIGSPAGPRVVDVPV